MTRDSGSTEASPTHEPAEQGLWLPIAEVARLRGVSKQAVHKRATRLEKLHVLEVRSGPRNTRLIKLAAYDKACSKYGDAVRELNGAASRGQRDVSDPGLAREQARRVSYQADLAEIELEERSAKLIPRADAEAAMVLCLSAMVSQIEQLPMHADSISAAAYRGGAREVRRVLKEIGLELRGALASEMQLVAARDEPDDPARSA